MHILEITAAIVDFPEPLLAYAGIAVLNNNASGHYPIGFRFTILLWELIGNKDVEKIVANSQWLGSIIKGVFLSISVWWYIFAMVFY